MLSKTSLSCLGVTLAAFVLLASPASADFRSLVARVPSDANALVLIDVEGVLNSPLGVREGWKAKMAKTYAEKPLIIPPDASRVVMAALIDTNHVESIWEVSLMDVTRPPSLDLMARAEGGYIDQLGQVQAVWSPINAYFIQLSPLMLGAVSPADRQFAARWAARRPGLASSSLSPYLTGAAGSVGTATPIVMAIDLQDVTCAMKVRRRLEVDKFDSLEGKNPDLDALSQLLGGLRGVTLRVSIGESAAGNGIVDFDSETAILAGFAKPLLLELLSQMGAFIDDFETWQVSAKGKQVSFGGKLSTAGLRRLLSVIEPPAPAQADPSSLGRPGASEQDVKAAASKQYYTTAREIIQKLDKQLQAGRSVAPLSSIALWMKRDATAISRLPILNVDPDLVKFASNISVRLNDAARVMSEGTVQTQARTSGIRSGFTDSKTYGWDSVGRANNAAQRRSAVAQAEGQRKQASAEERAKAVSQAAEIFKGAKEEAEMIRVEMTNRYQMEF
jgi:hypothetical protein